MSQSEAILERSLIAQLAGMGYERVLINDGESLPSNLKSQLEAFNRTKFTAKEFGQVLNHLSKRFEFEKAKILHDRFQLKREDGEILYVRFFDNENRLRNLFQVKCLGDRPSVLKAKETGERIRGR